MATFFPQFGMSGAAFWNLALAVQTFLLLVVRYQPPQFVKWVVLATGWAFAVVSSQPSNSLCHVLPPDPITDIPTYLSCS